MGSVIEGLVLALRSLPKAEKEKVIRDLLEDPDYRETIEREILHKILRDKSAESEVPESRSTRRLKGPSRPHTENGGGTMSQIERARREREKYISDIERSGISIDPTGSIWSRGPGGLWVAIPSATERKPDRWFLGIRQRDVEERMASGGVAIVLLCRSNTGIRLDFVIPPSKVKEILDGLSRSGGQLKFNVVKKLGERYKLLLTGNSPLDVTDYKSKLANLQQTG